MTPQPPTARKTPTTAASRRAWGKWVGVAGRLLAPVGACVAIAGAFLPYATFTIFSVPLNVPGALVWTGGVSASVGALALTQGRRFPWACAVLGLVPLYLGVQAAREMPRATVSRLLGIQRQFADVNSRLAQVGLPPVEPFGATVGARRDHAGPGPAWTAWGGALLVLGGGLQIAGDRLTRGCPRCGRLWSRERARGGAHGAGPAFCPACGFTVGPPVVCARCHGALEPGDAFCASCGLGVAAAASPPV